MEVALSVSNSRDLCCGWKQLGSVIVFRDARRYQNSLLERMRLSNFVLGISKLCSRWRHGFAEKPCVEVHSYTPLHVCGRRRLLSKVSALAGFDGFDDLTEKAKAEKLFDEHIKDAMDDFDLALACKRFPSISLGSSPPIELYDDTCDSSKTKSPLVMKDYEGFLRDLVNKWVDPDSLSEEWPSDNSSLGPLLQEEDQNACTTSDLVEKETHISDELKEDDSAHWTSLPDGVFLDSPLSCIPRLTKRQCRLLENSGFHTVRKLLNHFPRTYADMQNAHIGIDDGQYLISVGEVLSSRGVRASSSFSFLEVVVGCEIADHETQEMADDVDTKRKKTIHLHLKKFFRGVRFATAGFLRCLQGKFKVGDVVCVSGKVRTMRTKNHYEMREYHIDVIKDDKELSLRTEARPFSIYPSKGGSNPDFLRNMIVSVVKVLPAGIDPIPEAICQEFGLLSLHHAYVGIHQPKHVEEADLARKRLIFDEFFYLQLARLFQMLEGLGTHMEKDGLLDKYRKPELNSAYIEDWSTLTKKFLKALPYSLTPGQLRAVSEIIWDLKQPVPMNRLLQGDVGCGKTIVAFLACMEVIGSGYQVAFMVPTELLAIQHYEHMLGLLERMEEDDSKPTVALLTGSTPSKQSRVIRQDLQAGNISMVIGTHSLISDNIEFSALRIAVVDEQHRFGVIQRGRFNSKLYFSSQISKSTEANSDGPSKVMAPHVLAMSATPIPRTLALALYGDMSLTQITDLPPGRIPVETCVIEGNDEGFEGVYKMMLDELEDGGRVYIVYPVIEQSEQLPQLRAASADLDEVSDRFQDYNCGLLHGKMKGDEKDEALKQFRSGKTHILLSTQVIEIGVDVPDASMMVVMNAERFGMAQLHQLRGRVGRGTRKSKCILVASTASSLSRLRVLEKSSDGFHLANTDLLLRGPGDLLGKKQSGHLPEFPIARLEIDGNILQDAHAAALKILGDSHDLEKYPSLKVELSMRQPLCLLGD